jgi:biotin operon repressor
MFLGVGLATFPQGAVEQKGVAMVAGGAGDSKARRQWFENRLKLSTAIRRTRDISDSAYKLWAELAFGWAWNEPACFPSVATLAAATGKTTRTVFRMLKELEEHGLLVRSKQGNGNKYTLASTIPPKLQGAVLDNRKIVQKVKEQGLQAFEDPHQESCPDDWAVSHQEAGVGTDDVTKMSHRSLGEDVTRMSCSYVTKMSPTPSRDVMNSSHHPPDLCDTDVTGSIDVQEKYLSPEEKYGNGKREPAPASPASSVLSGMRDLSRASRGNEGSTDAGMAEADDLIAEAGGPSRPTRKRVKPRKGSPALVSGDGRARAPFPEAQGGSQSASDVQFDAPPPPPPVEAPEDVLRLLKGEAETRWGKQATHGYAMELSGELRGKVTNVLLRKYPPDVILAMVRLLVWDWEVARGVCFPFRKDVRYPDLLSLVQYAAELASRIETGFDYMATRRGALNTYHDLFIRKIPFIPDDDPF